MVRTNNKEPLEEEEIIKLSPEDEARYQAFRKKWPRTEKNDADYFDNPEFFHDLKHMLGLVDDKGWIFVDNSEYIEYDPKNPVKTVTIGDEEKK